MIVVMSGVVKNTVVTPAVSTVASVQSFTSGNTLYPMEYRPYLPGCIAAAVYSILDSKDRLPIPTSDRSRRVSRPSLQMGIPFGERYKRGSDTRD